MKFVLVFVGFLVATTNWAQSPNQEYMAKTLSEMQLEYLRPVEQTPNYLPSGKINYYAYDFGLELDEGATLTLVQTRKDDGNYIPQVMISALIATLATNDQDVDINMVSPSDSYLKDTNSDWAIEALFTPKDNLGEFKIAYLKSIFKAGIGVTNILYLAKTDVRIEPLFRYSD